MTLQNKYLLRAHFGCFEEVLLVAGLPLDLNEIVGADPDQAVVGVHLTPA